MRALPLQNAQFCKRVRRSLGEVLGERDVCMIGRLRRHVATACLCKLVCSNASTALFHPPRAASILSLGLHTLRESQQFQVGPL